MTTGFDWSHVAVGLTDEAEKALKRVVFYVSMLNFLHYAPESINYNLLNKMVKRQNNLMEKRNLAKKKHIQIGELEPRQTVREMFFNFCN